jgi:hypothetical protein
MMSGIPEFNPTIVVFVLAAIVALALWKVIDLLNWVFTHVSFTVT